MGTAMQNLKAIARNPGNLFYGSPSSRSLYKGICQTLLASKLHRRKQLLANLPEPDARLCVAQEDGYKIVPDELRPKAVHALLERAEQIKQDPSKSVAKEGKAHLNHLVKPSDLSQYPEFINFMLDPVVLGVVSDYLGELPVLGGVYFWHAHPIKSDWAMSQLYHCDHDDVRQLKIFVFASDVDQDSGPLTVVSAKESEAIRRELNYNFGGHLKDEAFEQYKKKCHEVVLTGKKGSMAFVDTSQVFHYGSRVSTKDRYMLVFQYLTISNFIINPFYRQSPYPYAHLVSENLTTVQKAVLNPEISG